MNKYVHSLKKSAGKSFLDALLFLAIFGLCNIPVAFGAGTFYVSPTGSDTNSGSNSAPWKTLQAAVSHLKAGDTLNVKAGSYAGFVSGWDDSGLYGKIWGTATQPITIQADPSAPAGSVIVNSHNSKNAHGIDLEPGCDYVIIKGFTVKNGDGTITKSGIRYTESIGGKILNNNVSDTGLSGIFTSKAQNVLVENNVTSNTGEHGIYISNSSDNAIVRGNTSFKNTRGGLQLNADISNGGDGIMTNALIEKNIFYDNGATGGAAINLDGVQNSTIKNNILYGNHASGIALFKEDGAQGSKNNVIYNNTIIMAADSRWPINIDNASTGNKVTNNILLNDNTKNGSIAISADSLAGFISDYNIVKDTFMATKGTTDANITLAQWQELTGQDKYSFISTSGDLFVDALANNYHLSAASPAIDKGTAVAVVMTDFAGDVRPKGTAMDIGAYEGAGAPITPAETVPAETGVSSGATAAPANQNLIFIILIAVLALFIVLLVIALIVVLWSTNRKNKYGSQLGNQNNNQYPSQNNQYSNPAPTQISPPAQNPIPTPTPNPIPNPNQNNNNQMPGQNNSQPMQ